MTATAKQVISHINAHYTDYPLAGWMIPKIAAETDCAQSTVYRAIKQLRAMGAMDGKTFIRRQWLSFDDLLPYFRNDMLLVDVVKAQRIAEECITTLPAVYAGLRWAQMMGQVEQLNGGSYGLLYRQKAGAA